MAEIEAATVLREAAWRDVGILFSWANTPESLRGKLRTQGEIEWDEHVRWFETVLADPDVQVWIAEDAGEPVGQVRMTRRDDRLEIDVYVTTTHRRCGTAQRMLEEAEPFAARRWPGRMLVARIRKENAPSYELFKKLGFVPEAEYDDHYLLVKKPE